jgi:hypothetical protein
MEYQDANGMVLLTSEQWRTVSRPVYTRIDFGSHNFRVRMPAWLLGTMAVAGLATMLALPAMIWQKTRKKS